MKKRTWLWIIAGVMAFTVVGCFAIVGTTMFVVMRQVNVQKTDRAGADRDFDRVRERFASQPPIFTNGERSDDGVARLRKLGSEYAGPTPESLHVMAWDDEEQRVVRVTVPFWLLRLGKSGSLQFGDVNVDRMQLDAEELEQAGPVLLVDQSRPTGRVLVWTE